MMAVVAVLLAVMLTGCSLAPAAGGKQVTDVKELAGTWRGFVSGGPNPAISTMTIRADGSYEAATSTGSQTVGQYYLENGKLRYRSSRSAGSATLSESKGKTYLTVVPDGTDATGAAMGTGKTDYERVQK